MSLYSHMSTGITFPVFYTAAEQFKNFTYGEIWLGWTENPADPQARQLDKFKGEALAALQAASHRLDSAESLSANLDVVREGCTRSSASVSARRASACALPAMQQLHWRRID